MNSPFRSKFTGRRVRLAGLALAIGAALAVAPSAGGWLASSSSPASAETTQTAAALADGLGTDDERAQFRADLKAARGLEGTKRAEAVKKVRDDARAGQYGDGIERRLDRRADRRDAFRALLPDELQADLKKLKSADADDRKAMRADIRKKALAGGYGDKVKDAYQLLQHHGKA